jgi:hypothetical protein
VGFVSLKAWRQRSAAQAEMRSALKTQVIEALGLDPGDAVTVNEIACADPGCPDMETIVLVMRVGQPTQAVRVAKAIDAIHVDDVLALVAEIRSAQREPRS